LREKFLDISRANLTDIVTASSLCLIPVLPDIIEVFVIPIAFLAAIATKNGRSGIANAFRNNKLLWIAIGLYILSCFLGIGVSTQIISSVLICLLWVMCIMAYISSATLTDNTINIDGAIFGFVLGGGVVSSIAIIQWLLTFNGMEAINPLWTEFERSVLESVGSFSVDLSFSGVRSASTFDNSGVLGFYLVMLFPMDAYFLSQANNRANRFWGLLLMLLCIGALMVTYSRMSYLTFIVLLMYIMISFSIVHYKNQNVGIRIFIGILLGLVIPLVLSALFLLLPNSVRDRFISTFSMDESIYTRFKIWLFCLGKLIDDPIKIFTGMGTGVQNTWNLLKGWNIQQPHVHNLFLQLLMESGILRVGSFILLLYALFLKLNKNLKKASAKEKYLYLSFIGFIIAAILNGTTDYIFVDPKICYIFFAVTGLMTGVPENEQN
jgi:O-antigen ligase